MYSTRLPIPGLRIHFVLGQHAEQLADLIRAQSGTSQAPEQDRKVAGYSVSQS